MRIRAPIASLLALCCMALSAPSSADGDTRSGDIQGVVNVCGTGGKPGILVYIPGRSYLVKTDSQGAFRLSNVPIGVYQLVYEQQGAAAGDGTAAVRAGRTTNLGAVNVCAATTVCTAQFDPVCGVDGRTYPNPCEAQRAGVLIASTGVCP